ncbi:MAG TPA: hypothetical protein VLE95_01405 [Chlamydiales bacterium]|nr:hypothetical protein [Chlamydiales bacterium]
MMKIENNNSPRVVEDNGVLKEVSQYESMPLLGSRLSMDDKDLRKERFQTIAKVASAAFAALAVAGGIAAVVTALHFMAVPIAASVAMVGVGMLGCVVALAVYRHLRYFADKQ